ncbi:MAG: signal peptidase I [Holophagales bacterium]|nr:signal peptidase I [Holophagales bacterium]
MDDRERENRRFWMREYFEALLIAGIFLGFTNTFLIKTFYIPSGSMEDTLLIGDHLFVNRFIYGQSPLAPLLPMRQPRRGDVVIFRALEDPRTDLVKRLIGVPGDEVLVKKKVLFLNGEEVDDSAFAVRKEPTVFPDRPFLKRSQRLRDNFGPISVPEEEYFFLGDNRDRSYDSRYWGTVPRHYLKGRALFIYWSYGGKTPDGKWHGWGEKMSQTFETAKSFFTKTEWSRTFHLVR